MMVCIIPITVYFMVKSNEIIDIVYGRGEFDKDAVLVTANTFYFYSIGMISFALRDVLIRAFYSVQDTKTPTINASIALVVNIILNIILSRYLGVSGLALATSIAGFVSVALLVISFIRKMGDFGIFNNFIVSFKVIVSSMISLLISQKVITEIPNILLGTLIGTIIFFLIYILLILIFRIEEVQIIYRLVFNKIKNSR